MLIGQTTEKLSILGQVPTRMFHWKIKCINYKYLKTPLFPISIPINKFDS